MLEATEPPVRYRLPGGAIGVDDVPHYLKASVHAAFWLGIAPLGLRALARAGARDRLSRGQRAWARGVTRALRIELTVEGLEHLNSAQAYIVTPLHESLVDAVVLLHLPLPLRFAVRREFRAWWPLGSALQSTRQVFICPERGPQSYRELLRAGRRPFIEGESLVVFPQGSVLGIETEFAGGAFRLARALERPLLPVAITGSHRVWEYPFSPRVRYGQRVNIKVLPPVSAHDVCSRAPGDIQRVVQQRLKAAALADGRAPPRRFVPARDGYWDGFAYRIDPAFADLYAAVAAHRASLIL